MLTQPPAQLSPQEQTTEMLHELGLPIHRLGYRQLCIAIPYFAQDEGRSLSKDVYPHLAEVFGYPDCKAAESAIRDSIRQSWMARDPLVWKKYFPNPNRHPSNKVFIATLAERLK